MSDHFNLLIILLIKLDFYELFLYYFRCFQRFAGSKTMFSEQTNAWLAFLEEINQIRLPLAGLRCATVSTQQWSTFRENGAAN